MFRRLGIGGLAVVLSAAALCTFGSDALRVSEFDLETGLRGADYWAGIPRHPAVVNAVGRAPDGTWLSLAGEWRFTNLLHGCGFRTTRFKQAAQVTPGRFRGPFSPNWQGGRTITVPGCWEAQGVGGEGMGTPHLCSDSSPKMLRGHWLGECYYVRHVTIPAAWAGKRIWMKIGGIRARGWVYVDNQAVAMTDAYAGAWKYEITGLVTPGKSACVVVVADNVVGARNAQPSATQRWGGIVRDIELEATPEVFIDDAWVRGDFDGRKAEVHVTLDSKRGRASASTAAGVVVRVTIDGETAEKAIAWKRAAEDVGPYQSSHHTLVGADVLGRPQRYQSSHHTLVGADVLGRPQRTYQNVISLPLSSFRPWSPEHPNLYWATIELVQDGQVIQTRRERFGVRKLEVRRSRFFLNNRPFCFRGFGDDSVYPISGITPPSREYHLAHFKKARAAGFNYVRLHTHCEVPEYFEAADEAGILVQPELSYYLDEPEDYFDYDPVRDAVERWVAFRRHPSYAINCSGNEGTLGPGAGRILYDFLKRLDPDRLVQDEDGGSPETPDRLATDRADFCAGPLNTWARGSFNPKRAFICHEYLNLAVKQDSRLEPSFTGVWKPTVSRAARADWLAKFGLTHAWGDRLQDAQHALQAFWQKDGIEHARKDPHAGGYCYWTIVDVSVRNEKTKTCTAQGLLDAFWNEKKGGGTLAEFARFNAPSCLLLDTQNRARDFTGSDAVDANWWIPGNPEETNRVYRSGETIPAAFLLAHYGEADLKAATLAWSLKTPDGSTLLAGSRAVGDVAVGSLVTLAHERLTIPALARPTRANLTLTLTDKGAHAPAQKLSNAWPFWLFPRQTRRTLSTRTVVCAYGSPEAAAARRAGKNILLTANQTGAPNCRLGWWWIGKQVGTAFLPHPALGDFPYEAALSPLHFRILHEGLPLPVEGYEERDLLAVGEGAETASLHLAAKIRADGGREVIAAGLDVTSDLPESISLYNNLTAWLMAEDLPLPPVKSEK